MKFLDRIPTYVMRYAVGTFLCASAIVLCYLGEEVTSIVPAMSAVVVLGSLLWDVYNDTKTPPTQGA